MTVIRKKRPTPLMPHRTFLEEHSRSPATPLPWEPKLTGVSILQIHFKPSYPNDAHMEAYYSEKLIWINVGQHIILLEMEV